MNKPNIVPPHLERLLRNGYVVWFYDIRPFSSQTTKEGEQFWLDDGQLHHKTVRMFHSKKIRTGVNALDKFETVLRNYQTQKLHLFIGEHHVEYSGHIDLNIFLRRTLRESFQLPSLPSWCSYQNLIDRIVPSQCYSCHKPKIVKTSAFNANKAKVTVFEWLSKKYPDAVIVPEFSMSSCDTISIADMVAFDTEHIVSVEIKAENDNYTRVAKQLDIYAENSDLVWLAIFETKSPPKDIHDNVGILSISSSGKAKLIRQAKRFAQPKTYLKNILCIEWQNSFRSIKCASKWLQNQRDGSDGLHRLGASILGDNARQFTIDMWRHRYWMEFVWRRDMFLSGKIEAVYSKREKHNNVYLHHYNKHHCEALNQPILPKLVDFAAFGFSFPIVEKRKPIKLKEIFGIKKHLDYKGESI